MHLYSNTDFPGLPVIQFLIILCIEYNSINSTIRNRLLLQFIHFRKVLLETEALHSLPETSFYMQKTKSSLIDTTYCGQRDLHSRKEILHSEGKEIFEYYKTFQRHSRHSSHKTFQGHSRHSSHSWHFSLSRQHYMHPGIPPFYSILQLECTFYTSTGFHRNSSEYQLRHYITTNFHSSKKGRCCIIGRNGHTLQNRILASFHLVK